LQVYPDAVSLLVPGGSTIPRNDCFGRQENCKA